MHIASTYVPSKRPASLKDPKTTSEESPPDLDTSLDRIEIEGDRAVRELHLKNAWQSAGVAAAGGAVIIAGTALASSGSTTALFTGAAIASVGAVVALAGIYHSDSAFIAATKS